MKFIYKMLKDYEIFSIYKKLQYMKKLLLVEKFDKMLCAVKSMCKNKSTALLFPDIFEADIQINVKIDWVKIEYIKCYGEPEDGCYDEELLELIRIKLRKEGKIQ